MKPAFLFLLIILSLCGPLSAADWGPWDVPASQPAPPITDTSPLQLAVQLFQKYISPIDGPRCPMYPTCSAYSLQALHRHGALFGMFLTVDRLYREGDPHEHGRPIEKWGYVRFADPLDSNDYWLTQ
ncbi:MAG: membrane protein insertion efficiency factor YidD [Deltaproteobacteria bacterium]|nr:membrane protein insertion efficiency factor YidD [Deltaproteobacteria bacterium]